MVKERKSKMSEMGYKIYESPLFLFGVYIFLYKYMLSQSHDVGCSHLANESLLLREFFSLDPLSYARFV